MNLSVDDTCVMIDGPWSHRFVSANGRRFHVVGSGHRSAGAVLARLPRVLVRLAQPAHGVADAGFRAVAVDLRGYGASDKPPRGYDGYTMAGDVAGLIRRSANAPRISSAPATAA